ncbi:hypothetical protein J437_LFUL013439 [Ladona fulva]|uniref:Uncharacterized protein n=1 Tax=Ladona fulva TaxID=123851 RepID=A0A8K0KPW6_LADFU|nr:hypothetical protein J437_LFUL013439 [Ladona fulva]
MRILGKRAEKPMLNLLSWERKNPKRCVNQSTYRNSPRKRSFSPPGKGVELDGESQFTQKTTKLAMALKEKRGQPLDKRMKSLE